MNQTATLNSPATRARARAPQTGAQPAPALSPTTIAADSRLLSDYVLSDDILLDADATTPLAVFQNAQGRSEALAIGLVHRVSPPDVPVLDDALEWIEPILSGAPIAQRAALAAIDGANDLTLDEGLELERQLYEECLTSEDRSEALAALRAGRKPNFSGQ